MKKILIVDDDVYIGNMLEEVLEKEGYGVLRAYSGTEAELLLATTTPDLILLDLMLPGLSGEELLKKIRGIPVIVLSAKTDVDSKADVLLGGAVDYITKPFAIKELLVRITVAFRKTEVAFETVCSYGDLCIDTTSRSVTAGGNEVKLTRTEYAILKKLIQNKGGVVSRNALLDGLSIDTPDCTDSSLKIHVFNLRKKLYAASGREYVESVWGIGYKISIEKS